MHEQAHCHDEAANLQLPITVAFCIIQIISQEECSSLKQHLMQICCSNCLVFLNWWSYTTNAYSMSSTASTDQCSEVTLNHSHMSIPGHSPWLPGCINVTQTITTVSRMVGLLPDRLYRHTYISISTISTNTNVNFMHIIYKFLFIAIPSFQFLSYTFHCLLDILT